MSKKWFDINEKPSCPSILIPFEDSLYSLPVYRMHVQAEFNVNTAFIKITGMWRNIAHYGSDCVFVLPTSGTVTSTDIRIQNRTYSTCVVPKTAAEEISAYADAERKPSVVSKQDKGDGVETIVPEDYKEAIPDLFRLPVGHVNSLDYVMVEVVYIEPLDFVDGKYRFNFPWKINQKLVAEGKAWDKMFSMNVIVNSAGPLSSIESSTHALNEVERKEPEPGGEEDSLQSIRFFRVGGFDEESRKAKVAEVTEAAEAEPGEGKPDDTEEAKPETGEGQTELDLNACHDFKLAYSVSADSILASCIVEQTPDNDEGSFLVFVTPPGVDPDAEYTRDVIFVLDRSGSMVGEPYQEALKSLSVGLKKLKKGELFNVIVFDNKVDSFQSKLVEATEDNVFQAVMWASVHQPRRGGTNTSGALTLGLKQLEKSRASREGAVQFCLLITDGCVKDERDICRRLYEDIGDVRMLTFGIGSYCNWYFLKMLAQIGRGFCERAAYKELIFAQMTHLIDMAAVPLVLGLDVDIPEVEDLEMYPFPIPDLFLGAPLTISGRFKGKFPSSFSLVGALPGGKSLNMKVSTRASKSIPVAKVYIKQRLDLLTAKAWLEESDEIEQQVIHLSVEHSVPSEYTTMIAYDNTGSSTVNAMNNLGDLADHMADDKKSRKALGKMKKTKKPKHEKTLIAIKTNKMWYKDKKMLKTVGYGTTAVVGVAALAFGSIALTSDNLLVFAEMFEGGECCEALCCCDGDCSCLDCLGF